MVTLDKTFYNILFKQEVVAAHIYFHILFLIIVEETFIKKLYNN